MPVLSNFRAISATLVIAGLCACKPATQSPKKAEISFSDVSTEIGKLKVDSSSFEDLPGNTRAEKLLYQSGIVTQMQSTMLIMIDTQVKTIRISGNDKLADEIHSTRDVMMEAIDLELASMVEDAGKLYESHFEPDEIERLIVLHSDPAMQKLIQNLPQITQGMLPIGETFGQRVGARYEEILKNRNSK